MTGDAAWPLAQHACRTGYADLPRDRRRIRLPAPEAALLNASMGHARDFDDTLDTGGSIQPGVSVLVSVLAARDSLEGIAGEMSGLRSSLSAAIPSSKPQPIPVLQHC
jgi:hypothetical protein